MARVPPRWPTCSAASTGSGWSRPRRGPEARQPATRRRLSALRADGTIGDDAFHKIEEELDRAELSAEAMDPGD
jgi:hypothetical protein